MRGITKKSITSELLNKTPIEKVWEACVELALERDSRSVSIIVDRMMPGKRAGALMPFELPIIKDIHDLDDAESRIIQALNSNQITISEGTELFKMLSERKTTITIRDTNEKLDRIEEGLNNRI